MIYTITLKNKETSQEISRDYDIDSLLEDVDHLYHIIEEMKTQLLGEGKKENN